MVCQGICHDTLQKDVKENRGEKASLAHSNCCPEPVSDSSVVENCTGGFVVQVLNDSDKVRADVVLPHSCPQCSMPYSVKGFLEVYKHVVKVLLMLQVSLTDNS